VWCAWWCVIGSSRRNLRDHGVVMSVDLACLWGCFISCRDERERGAKSFVCGGRWCVANDGEWVRKLERSTVHSLFVCTYETT